MSQEVYPITPSTVNFISMGGEERVKTVVYLNIWESQKLLVAYFF